MRTATCCSFPLHHCRACNLSVIKSYDRPVRRLKMWRIRLRRRGHEHEITLGTFTMFILFDCTYFSSYLQKNGNIFILPTWLFLITVLFIAAYLHLLKFFNVSLHHTSSSVAEKNLLKYNNYHRRVPRNTS